MLSDKYDIVAPIKQDPNSNSFVLEIKDKKTEKHFAVKVIKGINNSLCNVIFQREVGALTKLRTCENIVRYEHHDTYIDKKHGKCGRVYMELIYGRTLADLDVLDLSMPEKFNIINQIINAIQIAHENSIIHRDINPKNIMLTYDNKVKLIDFGISKIKDMINSDTTYQFATNRYAAPEVHNHSENSTEKSDIYSLGAVFYYLFTGEEPPISNDFEKVLNKPGCGIDIDLREIMKIMIKISPNERYKDIFQVKKALLKTCLRFSKSDVFSIIKVHSLAA